MSSQTTSSSSPQLAVVADTLDLSLQTQRSSSSVVQTHSPLSMSSDTDFEGGTLRTHRKNTLQYTISSSSYKAPLLILLLVRYCSIIYSIAPAQNLVAPDCGGVCLAYTMGL